MKINNPDGKCTRGGSNAIDIAMSNILRTALSKSGMSMRVFNREVLGFKSEPSTLSQVLNKKRALMFWNAYRILKLLNVTWEDFEKEVLRVTMKETG